MFDFSASAPAQHHSPTSKAAGRQIEAPRTSLRDRVLECIREHGPLTDEEIQQRTGMNPSTQRPRRIELMRAGLIVEAGVKPTASGRKAVAWGVAP